MKKVLLTIVFLCVGISIKAQNISEVISGSVSGQLCFKMQSVRGTITSLDFNSRYKWHAEYTKKAELVVKIDTLKKEVIIRIDRNSFVVDRINLRVSDYVKGDIKLGKKDFVVTRVGNDTFVKISTELFNIKDNKLPIFYNYKIDRSEVPSDFVWILNEPHSNNFVSTFDFIVPQFIEFSQQIEPDAYSILKTKKQLVAESFNYNPLKAGKVTTENYRYSSTKLGFDVEQKESLEKEFRVLFNLVSVQPIGIND